MTEYVCEDQLEGVWDNPDGVPPLSPRRVQDITDKTTEKLLAEANADNMRRKADTHHLSREVETYNRLSSSTQ